MNNFLLYIGTTFLNLLYQASRSFLVLFSKGWYMFIGYSFLLFFIWKEADDLWLAQDLNICLLFINHYLHPTRQQLIDSLNFLSVSTFILNQSKHFLILIALAYLYLLLYFQSYTIFVKKSLQFFKLVFSSLYILVTLFILASNRRRSIKNILDFYNNFYLFLLVINSYLNFVKINF